MAQGKEWIGARIKTARIEKGWKQKHLAAAVHVEPVTVSRWERGATTPDFDALALIAEATGKPVSYLLAEETSNPGEPKLSDAVERIEAAADRIAAASERIASALGKWRPS